jgi:hypothetical protein
VPRHLTRHLQLAALLLLLHTNTGHSQDSSSAYLEHGDSRLELRISNEFEPAMQRSLSSWIDFLSQALLQVYGRWPRQYWQISVAPVSAGADEPIPWAQVHRGDVDRVEFFTASQTSTEQLKRAWTGYHELAHLLIPYRGWGDAWFSEGLASYYQNLLQARAGILTEQQMWQALYDGFQRGRADNQFDGQPLQLVSDELRDNGGFMRVYWSGAWYFLTADARLRQQSGGKVTLDQALDKLNRCCANQRMSVPEMVHKLDELNRVLLFQRLYQQSVAAQQLPPFEPIFASLGITLVEGKIQLQKEGPGARLREQMARNSAL